MAGSQERKTVCARRRPSGRAADAGAACAPGAPAAYGSSRFASQIWGSPTTPAFFMAAASSDDFMKA